MKEDFLRFNGAVGTNPDTMTITYVTPVPSNIPNPALGQSPQIGDVDDAGRSEPRHDGRSGRQF